MFNFFKKKRKFRLTFIAEYHSVLTIPAFENKNDNKLSNFYTNCVVETTGKVNREIILAEMRKAINKSKDDTDKKIFEFLLNHAVLIAWSEEID